MKPSNLFTSAAAVFLIGTGQLVSQIPQAPVPPLPQPAVTAEVKLAQIAQTLDQANQQIKQAVQALQAIKTANEQLIEKQQKALEKLDALQKEADQVRILGKRN